MPGLPMNFDYEKSKVTWGKNIKAMTNDINKLRKIAWNKLSGKEQKEFQKAAGTAIDGLFQVAEIGTKLHERHLQAISDVGRFVRDVSAMDIIHHLSHLEKKHNVKLSEKEKIILKESLSRIEESRAEVKKRLAHRRKKSHKTLTN